MTISSTFIHRCRSRPQHCLLENVSNVEKALHRTKAWLFPQVCPSSGNIYRIIQINNQCIFPFPIPSNSSSPVGSTSKTHLESVHCSLSVLLPYTRPPTPCPPGPPGSLDWFSVSYHSHNRNYPYSIKQPDVFKHVKLYCPLLKTLQSYPISILTMSLLPSSVSLHTVLPLIHNDSTCLPSCLVIEYSNLFLSQSLCICCSFYLKCSPLSHPLHWIMLILNVSC